MYECSWATTAVPGVEFWRGMAVGNRYGCVQQRHDMKKKKKEKKFDQRCGKKYNYKYSYSTGTYSIVVAL